MSAFWDNMTTSYELSLRLKELGVEQEGEYYWVKREGVKWSLELNKLEDYFEFVVKHKSQLVDWVRKYQPLCRAFTLGELVRELGNNSNRLMCVENDMWTIAFHFSYDFFDTPEEAAGELYCEILKQKV